MIFKNGESGLSFLGKSFADIVKDRQSGLGRIESIFGKNKFGISQSDYNSIIAYYDAVESGDDVTQVWDATMSKTSDAAQALAVNISKGNISLEEFKSGASTSTASLLGLNLATTALNTALSVGIAMFVQWGASLINNVIHAQEQLHENVQEVVSDYQTQRDELRNNQTTFDGLISKYAELSKGVNALGQNVSLTSEDYDEYHSVANQIGEMIPDMVAGFDSQGNAILKCRDNINELVDAYNKLLSAN